MNNIIAAVWVLVTVTNGGEVRQTSNFTSEYACQQALSVAKTGMTVEEIQERDEKAATAKKRRDDEWQAAHPPREPKTSEERKMVEQWKRDGSRLGALGATFTVGDDGLIYDWPPDRYSTSWTTVSYSTSWTTVSIHEIKFAKCFVDKPTK